MTSAACYLIGSFESILDAALFRLAAAKIDLPLFAQAISIYIEVDYVTSGSHCIDGSKNGAFEFLVSSIDCLYVL